MSEIAALRSAVEALAARIAVIESGMGDCIDPYMQLGLTRTQAKILALLMRRRQVTVDQLYYALYGDQLDPPDIKTVDVLLCFVRKKLRQCVGTDIKIIRKHMGPIFITSSTKKQIEQAVAQLPPDLSV